MQPKSSVRFNRKTFDILKIAARNISVTEKGRRSDPGFASRLPLILGIKLTNRCNLRCKHCYEWNEKGYHRRMDVKSQNYELDFDIVQKLMRETREVKSNIYLWGGEPLYYGSFDRIAGLLEKDERITAICTNGLLLKEKIDPIIKIGDLLELLIAVDGFEEENDMIRGKGTFKKVLENIKYIIRLRKKGIFKGKISLHIMISESMIPKLYDFLTYFEMLGVDNVIVCYPWYISPEQSGLMSDCYKKNFGFLNASGLNGYHSWDAFKFQVDPSNADKIINILKKIYAKTWSMRIRIQPDISPCDISGFLAGKQVEVQGRKKCFSISQRMDVLPDGSVSSCKHFPEFTVGNLKDMSVYELWNCETFRKVRCIMDKGIMPVCNQCDNLYIHGKRSETGDDV